MKADIVIIGGGPAGLMAALSAVSEKLQTTLIDKGDKLGRKLAISGGGRCNVTNAGAIDEIIQNVPGNGKFLYSALSQFSNQDIIRFFEDLGVKLKEEDRGRMFPVSDKAKDVVQALLKKMKELGVTIKTNAPREIVYENDRIHGVQLQSGEFIQTDCVIVAVGGMSAPQTGSTGDGYAWAKQAGHTITELYPTEAPITSNEPFIQNKSAQGLPLRDIRLAVINPKTNKKVIEHEGDMIFTHFGLSGPAALRCSQFVIKTQKKFKRESILMTIDLFPRKTLESISIEINERIRQAPKKAIKNVLKGYLPERFVPLLLLKAEVDEETRASSLSRVTIDRLTDRIKKFPVEVNGTLSIEKAFVTGGGVALKEINPKTMESLCMPGLFFCGEILDVHGYTGGYNITAAFTTGYAAGKGAANYCQSSLFPAE